MKITRPESRQLIPKNAKKVFSGVVFDVYQWQQNKGGRFCIKSINLTFGIIASKFYQNIILHYIILYSTKNPHYILEYINTLAKI